MGCFLLHYVVNHSEDTFKAATKTQKSEEDKQTSEDLVINYLMDIIT
jgi:hypothetical protein